MANQVKRPKRVPHQPKHRKGIPWPVCSGCGLVYLKNEITRLAIQAQCEADE